MLFRSATFSSILFCYFIRKSYVFFQSVITQQLKIVQPAFYTACCHVLDALASFGPFCFGFADLCVPSTGLFSNFDFAFCLFGYGTS